eukprot:UN25950
MGCFTVMVDLPYSPRTSTCPRNFPAQANSPTSGNLSNKSLSQYGGGKVSKPPRQVDT